MGPKRITEDERKEFRVFSGQKASWNCRNGLRAKPLRDLAPEDAHWVFSSYTPAGAVNTCTEHPHFSFKEDCLKMPTEDFLS